MATITQQAITLSSQNQLRTADRLAREWAIAHAGSHQGQARRELGGSEPFREWRNDNLCIRIAKLTTGSYKQVQLVSANYEHTAGAEPYTAYVMTYATSKAAQPGGRCISVVSRPDELSEAQLPWDDKAGLVGLERVIESINNDRARLLGPADGTRKIASINDLFPTHDTAIVLTEEGQEAAEFRELMERHSDWADVASISAAEQLAICRELPDYQLGVWVRARIAIFSRYADSGGRRLRMMETDCAQADALLEAERDRAINSVASRNALTLLKVLESTSIMPPISTLTDAKEMAEVLVDSVAKPPAEESGASASVATQQRIYVLEDRLRAAETTIAELREHLAQYESYDNDTDAEAEAEPDLSPEAVADHGRHIAVLDAITDPDRFPRLRFLTNFDKALADYGKPRPNGAEIVAALDAINKLAQAWHNTPNGAIGPWDNYFHRLTGWSHANSESEFTMARYGDKRSFSDQEHRRQVTIERHLTYRGSNGGLQIYFDKDDVTDKFIVGYIGEHLPYATSRS